MYYVIISADYAGQGASWVDGLVLILLFSVPLYVGIIAGGIALARGLPVEATRA